MLDTLVNKTEQYVIRDPIEIKYDYERDRYKGCTLISETEALVFAAYEDLLVNLVEK